MTARYFVAGWPVAHSRSPGMHNAAFEAAGIDAVYGRLEVAPGAFEEAMEELPEGTRGLNVTHPHKEAAWEWARARGELSARACAWTRLQISAARPCTMRQTPRSCACSWPGARRWSRRTMAA